MGRVNCSYCSKEYSKDNRHINENRKLGHKYYCSIKCQSLGRSKQKEFKCENPKCNRIFKRSPHEVSPHNYCSSSCFAICDNTRRIRKKKICKILKANKQRNINLAGSKLGGKNRWLEYKPKHSKESIIKAVHTFVKMNGRIPLKREAGGLYSASRKYFGTWNKAIEAAGFKPNPVMFANNCFAYDGHICNSIAEKIIDDFLFQRNIFHLRNVSYPEGLYTADFKIGNKIIEYFGLAGEHVGYDEIRKIKQKIAKKHALQFIEIYPEDLSSEDKLNRVLKANLNTYAYGVEAKSILM